MGLIMKEVFRVQNIRGVGPYTGFYKDEFRQKMTKRHSDDEVDHPVLEVWPPVEEEIFYGFKSLTYLKGWFTKWELEKLYKLGYFVYKITKIKIVKKDDYQVIFKKNNRWAETNQEIISFDQLGYKDDYNQKYISLESIYGE